MTKTQTTFNGTDYLTENFCLEKQQQQQQQLDRMREWMRLLTKSDALEVEVGGGY